MLEVQYKNNKREIFAPLKDRWLETKSEEIVRQDFICKLINEYDYSLKQMAQEIKLTTSQRGTGRASADLVIWKTKEDKEQNKTAFLVVELKAGNLKLKVEDCYQGYNYATWSRAKLFAISNGSELQVYKTIENELPLHLQPVNDIPNAKTILDDEKLKKALAKTKEFTGDEFAKLLHKCHNIIRNNDKLSPEAAFDEISKILFIKIMYERKPEQRAKFDKVQFEKSKTTFIDKWKLEVNNQIKWQNNKKEEYVKNGNFDEANKGEVEILKLQNKTPPSYMQHLFEEVKKDFAEDGIFDENEKIKIREGSFEAIVTELQIYNLTSTSADVKGIAFEKFLGRTFRGELGQFFTPRTIVDFIVDLLEPSENELVCDPCAGSGGFLIKVFETIKKQIDDEYIELKKQKQKKIFGENLENIDDENLKKQYDEFVITANKEQEKRIQKLSHKSIFGTDANPRMARVSKMNMIMHGDGHNGIHHNDGLLNINGIFRNRFDMIVTNPPFGTTLNKTTPTVEEDDRYTNETTIEKYRKEYGEELYNEEIKQVTHNIGKSIRGLFEVGKTSGATEVLFVERCLDLLKAGGRMGIVLPEGVLNSSNLQKARDYFESRAKILLIVSLPQDVFISSGATVKTSLVFFKKFTDKEQQKYATIKQQTTDKIDVKYAEKIKKIEKQLKLKVKDAKIKDEKKLLKKQLKDVENKKQQEIKAIIKNEFNYEIPIADIKQAGITTTGKQGDSQLPELAEVFTQYRKQNTLW
ncbi:restriction endonuclease subunit M [Candidatus Thiodubiliella endoseptemdiera]|uniref:restriction endonuclease subunit M n=1 Tax=Candidatus Thiodubiliella endoseptemdiera TaxID=2738886 RepID=UPI0034DF9555